jgi:hypothetical protein
MDLRTQQVLQAIKSHSRIREVITILCYFLISGGLFTYVFHAINKSSTIKLVNDYKKNPQEYKTEKVMTNPRIKFQYNDNQVYNIRAKKAFHKDESEVTLYDVFADGEAGNITAGELKIYDEGNHLVFTKNPVMILKQTEKK